MQNNLTQVLETQKQILYYLPFSAWLKDINGKILFVNNKYVQSCSEDVENIIGKTDFDIFPKELAEKYRQNDNHAIKHKKQFSKIQRDDQRSGGKWVELCINPLIYKDEVIGTFGFTQDISDNREIEIKLEEERELLKNIVNILPHTFYVKDTESRFILANTRLCNLMKVDSPDDLVGKDDFMFYPEHHAKKYLKDEQDLINERKEIIETDEEVIDDKGDTRIYYTIKVPLRDNSGNIYAIAGIGKDITGRKTAEERIKESQQQLQELNITKDKLLSIIAHDLKNPIHNVLSLADMIIQQFDELKKSDLMELVSMINQSTKNAYNLLENLLEWSRSQSGRIKFEPEKIEISSFVNKVFSLLDENARQKNITLSFETFDVEEIEADLNMLRTILRNLLSNAIKFTNQGGKIKLSVLHDDKNTIFQVNDTGIGMSQFELSKLFRNDVHHSTNGTANEKGTGLGLLICKEFVDRHGGKIFAESEKGKGSSFRFTIPKQN